MHAPNALDGADPPSYTTVTGPTPALLAGEGILCIVFCSSHFNEKEQEWAGGRSLLLICSGNILCLFLAWALCAFCSLRPEEDRVPPCVVCRRLGHSHTYQGRTYMLTVQTDPPPSFNNSKPFPPFARWWETFSHSLDAFPWKMNLPGEDFKPLPWEEASFLCTLPAHMILFHCVEGVGGLVLPSTMGGRRKNTCFQHLGKGPLPLGIYIISGRDLALQTL